ncbi:hypothetical protein [Dactylosporangium sp. CA-092794]|uniref:hypothetical protein n=1 Tax=Dactylosporangium sp. CA-092794 TaxID=3239929 RepID=UPI003D8C561A
MISQSAVLSVDTEVRPDLPTPDDDAPAAGALVPLRMSEVVEALKQRDRADEDTAPGTAVPLPDGRCDDPFDWWPLLRPAPSPDRLLGRRSSRRAFLPRPVAAITAAVIDPVPESIDAPADRRPATERRAGRRSAHGVDWLPPRPPVNTEAFDVYVSCTTTPQIAADDGVPSPDLFLLGRLEARPITESADLRHLLRIRVEPGGAVELGHLSVRVPPHLQHLIHIGLYLLPVGWLDKARLVAGYTLSEAGATCVERFIDQRVTIRSSGARHGIDGLPNDAVRWPERRHRRAYAMLPETGTGLPADRLTLLRRKPEPERGYRLVQLRVPRRRAIDTVRTEVALRRLTALRSRLAGLRAAGAGVVLPPRSYERVEVRRVYVPAGGGWRPVPGAAPLADLIGRPAGESPAASDSAGQEGD